MSQRNKIIIIGNPDVECRLVEWLTSYDCPIIYLDNEEMKGRVTSLVPDAEVHVIRIEDGKAAKEITMDEIRDGIWFDDIPTERHVHEMIDTMDKIKEGFAKVGKRARILNIEVEKLKEFKKDHRQNEEVRFERNQNRLRAKFHRR
jgi:hypothetical protein